jgi:hypothetical protein
MFGNEELAGGVLSTRMLIINEEENLVRPSIFLLMKRIFLSLTILVNGLMDASLLRFMTSSLLIKCAPIAHPLYLNQHHTPCCRKVTQ